MLAAGPGRTDSLLPWITKKAQNRFAWLEWILFGNLSFSFCEQKTTRRYTNLPDIARKHLWPADMEKVAVAVEGKIAAEMLDCFGILFDGWTHDSEHFVAVFACDEIDEVECRSLLAMAPVLEPPEEDSETAVIQRVTGSHSTLR
ncbi:hypothetical protein F441_12318 [Phytophthora nicotianae CJ01A1]|uniref:Uncharacterized protein n=1 Tax=Phytophthora nicotianae CJ01A1 TaxID=1317063 RepID=W2WQ54_PHYNI|nr:hypothetical protein F441_12318 [Phytophthora nicotianae CJ01A1]